MNNRNGAIYSVKKVDNSRTNIKFLWNVKRCELSTVDMFIITELENTGKSNGVSEKRTFIAVSRFDRVWSRVLSK